MKIWKLSGFIYKKFGPKISFRVSRFPMFHFFITLTIKLFGKKEIIIKSKYGFRMKLPIEEYMIGGYFHLGEINPFETNVLRTILREGDTFLDVGGFRGWYSLNALQKVGKTGNVIAFEPNPVVAGWLLENCKLNGFKNIKIHKVALAEKTGSSEFWVGDEASLGSLKKVNAMRETKQNVKKINVPIWTIDTFYKSGVIKKPKLIKIDAEGVDLEVIMGAKNVLKRYSPFLIVEVFGLTWETDEDRHKKIISYLAQLGYKPFQFVTDGLDSFNIKKKNPQVINLFFAKNTDELRKLNLIHR